jgi:hypothetical protein
MESRQRYRPAANRPQADPQPLTGLKQIPCRKPASGNARRSGILTAQQPPSQSVLRSARRFRGRSGKVRCIDAQLARLADVPSTCAVILAGADQSRGDQARFDSVNRQCAIDAAPQVGMLDIDTPSEMLPHKSIVAPPRQRLGKGSDQVAIIAQQSHRRWAVDRLETSHRGQQGQPIEIAQVAITSRQHRRAVRRLERETPISTGQGICPGFTHQQIVGAGFGNESRGVERSALGRRFCQHRVSFLSTDRNLALLTTALVNARMRGNAFHPWSYGKPF